MAAEIKKEFGVVARMSLLEDGTFDVVVDGKTVFSRRATGRFPKPGEVTAEIRKGK